MSEAELRRMINAFRVSDLQVLLGFAGRNKNGKKSEMQTRAIELLTLKSSAIELKIREIYKTKYETTKVSSDIRQQSSSFPQPSGSCNNHGYRPPYDFFSSLYGMTSNKYLRPVNLLQQAQYNMVHIEHPDVKFKDLPFYDSLGQLLKPTNLSSNFNSSYQEKFLEFYLTPQQVNEALDQDVRILMRFCVLEISCEQDDEFPSGICAKVNDMIASIPPPIQPIKPGVEPIRPKVPVDITHLCSLTSTQPNKLHISWSSISFGKQYVIGVYLTRKLTSEILISRLKTNGVRNPDHTTAIIKEKLCPDRDSEIATMSLKGSLICPLGKTKMILPCRAFTCTHLQCFDASLYIHMNEKKPKWICPVCDKPALFKDLAIDGLFLNISTSAPSECNEVQFHEDGSWTSIIPRKKLHQIDDDVPIIKPEIIIPKPEKKKVEVIDLDSDSDTEESWSFQEYASISPPLKKMKVAVLSDNTFNSAASSSSSIDPRHSFQDLDQLINVTNDVDSEKNLDLSNPTDPELSPSHSVNSSETIIVQPINEPSNTSDNASLNLTSSLPNSPSEPIDIANETGPSDLCNFDLFSLLPQYKNDQINFPEITEESNIVAID